LTNSTDTGGRKNHNEKKEGRKNTIVSVLTKKPGISILKGKRWWGGGEGHRKEGVRSIM